MSENVAFATTRHLVLHFDLDTGVDRGPTRKAIEAITKPAPPRRLTGSVFLIPIDDASTALDFAMRFWGSLATATKGTLRKGDAFFVHFSGTQTGFLDVLFQRPTTDTLDVTPEKSILEALFLG